MFGIKKILNNNDKYEVVFDIGSSSVAACIAEKDGKKSKIIWSKRIDYLYNDDDDYKHYIRTMYATLLEVGMKVTGEGFLFVKNKKSSFSARNVDVVCVLSHPWFIPSVTLCERKTENKFQVSDTVINKMEEECLKKAFASQEVLSWQDIMGTPIVLESNISVVKLGGYVVNTFKNKTTNNLTMQFYFSIVSDSVQKHIEEVIKRIFPNHDLLFSSSTKVFSNLWTHTLHGESRRSVLVEIGGEVTGVSLVKDGILENVKTVPFGSNYLLKEIAPKSVSLKESLSAVAVLMKKVKTAEDLPKNIKKLLVDWNKDIVNAVNDVSDGVIPPTGMFVVAEDMWFSLFKMSFEMQAGEDIVDFSIKNIKDIVKIKEQAEKSTEDSRLSTIISLLNDCTLGKGMCYTEKKS